MLLDLPPEILLVIYKLLPSFADWLHLRQTCRLLDVLADGDDELIVRALVFREHLADERSCNAAQLSLGIQSKASDEFDPQELVRARVAQSSTTSYFDSVHSWRELARRRRLLDRAWLRGQCDSDWLHLSVDHEDDAAETAQARERARPPPEHALRDVWRFKIDQTVNGESGLVMTSGDEGRLACFDTRTHELIWSCCHPIISPFAHIELSAGYIATTLPWDLAAFSGFIIFRRNNLEAEDRRNGASGASPPLSAESRSIRLPPTLRRAIAECSWGTGPRAFTPYKLIVHTNRLRAFKARFPLLGSVNTSPQREVTLWEIKSGTLVQSFSIESMYERHPGLEILYLDFDNLYVYIATSVEVAVWSRASKTQVSSLPFIARVGASFEPAPALLTHWNGVHHDTRGKHLVAGSYKGDLLWVCDTHQCLHRSHLFPKRTVKLVMNHPIDQLCVENDRVVFSTLDHRSGRQSLWLINLRHFDDLSDFCHAPPEPLCITPVFPSTVPISRIEMSSDAVYVTAQGLLDQSLIQSREELDKVSPVGRAARIAWRSLDGADLCVYADRTVIPNAPTHWTTELGGPDNYQLADAIVCYRFGPA